MFQFSARTILQYAVMGHHLTRGSSYRDSYGKPHYHNTAEDLLSFCSRYDALLSASRVVHPLRFGGLWGAYFFCTFVQHVKFEL